MAALALELAQLDVINIALIIQPLQGK